MSQDEKDLLLILGEQASQSGKRPSIVEAGMKNLPDWSKDRLLAAAQGLEREGYILNAAGPLVNVDLSSKARKLMAAPQHPAPSQTVNIGVNYNSPIQQLGAGAAGTQTTSYNVEKGDLEKIVALFREYGSELQLEPKLQKQADAQVATIAAQLTQEEPNRVIVHEAGKSLKTIAEGALGNLAATALSTPALWNWLLTLPF